MAKGQKQKERAAPSHLGPLKKIKKFQKKKAKDAAARTPCASEANEVGDAAAGRKENGATGRLAGFMFVCESWRHCYDYRVLGLPRQQLKLVKKIRKGTMLFIYDSKRLLLYGGYEAISNGGLNLVATAFNGTRPAQVKFKVVNEFMPLHKNWFGHVILENDIPGKFNPELNSEQVKQLMSLFPLPISALLCLGEQHRLTPDRSLMPPPQDAYRQPVAGTGLPPPSYGGRQSRIMDLLKQVEGIKEGLSQRSSDMDRVEGLLKQVEGIMDRVEGIMDRVTEVYNLIRREQPPAPPSRDNGSLKATEGERASQAGHPPSAE